MKHIAIPFEWKVICQVCRANYKASEVRMRWDGLLTCDDCWEPRHPLDMPQAPFIDERPLPFTSPDATPVEAAVCSAEGRMGVAGYGVAGCATAGFSGATVGTSGVLTGTFADNNGTI